MLMKCELKVLSRGVWGTSVYQVDVGSERFDETDIPTHGAILLSFAGMLEEMKGQFVLVKHPELGDMSLINKDDILQVLVTSVAPDEGE